LIEISGAFEMFFAMVTLCGKKRELSIKDFVATIKLAHYRIIAVLSFGSNLLERVGRWPFHRRRPS
jgi:hypothetical protein